VAIIFVLHICFLLLSFGVGAIPFLHFSRRERITALFCSPQKSLAIGLPLINIFYAGNPASGLVSLPLLTYHPMQLLVASTIVPYVKGIVPKRTFSQNGHFLFRMGGQARHGHQLDKPIQVWVLPPRQYVDHGAAASARGR